MAFIQIASGAVRAQPFRLGVFRDHETLVVFALILFIEVCTILVWRGEMRWTTRRILVTVCAVVICESPLMVRFQGNIEFLASLTLLSAWYLLRPTLWWGSGGNRTTLSIEFLRNDRRNLMSRDMARCSMAMGLVPLFAAVCILSYELAPLFVSGYSRSPWGFNLSNAIAALSVMLVWFAIWYGVVAWTLRTALVTAILAVCAIACLCIGFLGTLWVGPWSFYNLFQAMPFLGVAIWIAGTAWRWSKSSSTTPQSALDPDQVCCPACNYSLKGLKEVHCPECGWTSTVDQIVKLAFENAATG